MKRLLTLATLSAVCLSAHAIDYKNTGRGQRVQCPTPGVNCQPVTTTPVAPQAPAAPAPVAAPQLHSGGPGAPAQIGSASLVDVSSQVQEAVIKPVHYFETKMRPETYTVQVPVEYNYKEKYVEHVNKPVTKTGVTHDVKTVTVPVTRYHQVKTPVYDQCGKFCHWETHDVPYTAYENRTHTEERTYSYVENQVEPRVRERDRTGVRYEDAERERWIQTTEVATKYLKFQTITTTYTVSQSSVSEVPKAAVEGNN